VPGPDGPAGGVEHGRGGSLDAGALAADEAATRRAVVTVERSDPKRSGRNVCPMGHPGRRPGRRIARPATAAAAATVGFWLLKMRDSDRTRSFVEVMQRLEVPAMGAHLTLPPADPETPGGPSPTDPEGPADPKPSEPTDPTGPDAPPAETS
jgi:hypothetical protein